MLKKIAILLTSLLSSTAHADYAGILWNIACTGESKDLASKISIQNEFDNDGVVLVVTKQNNGAKVQKHTFNVYSIGYIEENNNLKFQVKTVQSRLEASGECSALSGDLLLNGTAVGTGEWTETDSGMDYVKNAPYLTKISYSVRCEIAQ